MAKCRVCDDEQVEQEGGTCDECREYGQWYASVSKKTEQEVTGEIDCAGLLAQIERDAASVRIELFPAETFRSNGTIDYSPAVVGAEPDNAGIKLVLCDRSGQRWEVWRPFRMPINLLIDGVPSRLSESASDDGDPVSHI